MHSSRRTSKTNCSVVGCSNGYKNKRLYNKLSLSLRNLNNKIFKLKNNYIMKKKPNVLKAEIKTEDLKEPDKMKTDQNISGMIINRHEAGTDKPNIQKVDPDDNEMEEKEVHSELVRVKSEDPNDSGKEDDCLTPVNFVAVKIECPDAEWDPPAIEKEIIDPDITEDQGNVTDSLVSEPRNEILGESSVSQEYILSGKCPEDAKSGMKPTAVKCDVCNKAFNRRDHLRAHYRIHTGEKPYMCDYCNRFFSQSGTLHAHLRIHTGEKPYKCDYCDKTFSVRTNLKSHTKVHTQERLRKCGLCDKVFKMPLSLKTHLKTHAGIRTFKCDECGEDFSKKDGLNKHMRTHTGEKPHKCNICGREFTFGPNLNRHVRSHLRVKPYECSKCDKKYAKSEQLLKHALIHVEMVNSSDVKE